MNPSENYKVGESLNGWSLSVLNGWSSNGSALK